MMKTFAKSNSISFRKFFFPLFLCLFIFSNVSVAQIDFEDSFQDLFTEVQTHEVFKDSKTFPDCIPIYSPSIILEKYRSTKASSTFALRDFVHGNFLMPSEPANNFSSNADKPITDHIESLWNVLIRKPDTIINSTLIPLPYPYVVPGGRFREVYYWDSYFTMIGLMNSGKKGLIRNMVNNFAYLIDTIGFIPNGNRTYYLSRSQPPYFSLMVKLLASLEGDSVLVHYLPQLEKEYSFWMNGKETVNKENGALRRVVRMNDGEILNRYWDDKATPRTESYKEDVITASKSKRPAEEIYRNIRAACESGWDFSSRWFRDGKNLETIHTTEIIPVDLNSLLYHLELLIAKGFLIKGDMENYKIYFKLSENRKKAILKYCWDSDKKFFYDYDFITGKNKSSKTLAALYPLYFGIASEEQAKSIAKFVNDEFLLSGGVSTTLIESGQQWDSPNGWAPLQWITIKGLELYKLNELAIKIRNRWIKNNLRVYENTGRMVEKYNVKDITLKAGGGEYALQDGFGWSNGVLSGFIRDYEKTRKNTKVPLKHSTF